MITVSLTGSPKLYSLTCPPGSTVLGIVCREPGDAGALVRIDATGLLVQVNAGVVRSLPQREVKLALAEAMLEDGGAAALAGRHGGRSTSDAKRLAARANGMRGGRPPRGA